MTEISVSGVVTDVFMFRGSADRVGVLTLLDAEGKKQKVVGVVEGIRSGDNVEVTGHEHMHPHYGMQVRAQHINTTLPSSKKAATEWLMRHFGVTWNDSRQLIDDWYADFSSARQASPGAFSTTASSGDFELARLWSLVTADAPSVREHFEKYPSGKEEYPKIREYVVRKNVTDSLVRMGLDTKEAFQLYTLRGAKAADELRQDPYVVYYYLEGVPFKKVDDIYLAQAGHKKNDDRRVRAVCLYELRSCTNEGHTAMYYDDFVDLLAELHPEFTAARLVSNIQTLMPEFIMLYGDPSMVQLSSYAQYEAGIAEFVVLGHVETLPPGRERDEEF